LMFLGDSLSQLTIAPYLNVFFERREKSFCSHNRQKISRCARHERKKK
jgi:hypothetical protein